VLNTEADEAGMAVIRHGNERVLRARFNDARFFWEFDQRVPLFKRQDLLRDVTFQKDLGSYFDKSQAIRGTARMLVGYLTSHGATADPNVIDTAALVAKTDLTTELVKEFTELQGIVGGLYAEAQELGDAVASAIYDQYKPKSMEDSVPRTTEGAIVAIADKASTIAGMFGLKLEPTGSKDPFALRRAANGIVKILAETRLPIGLLNIAVSSCTAFPSKLTPEDVRDRMLIFFAERVEFYLRDVKGFAYDVVKAVMAVGADDVPDVVSRAEAVTSARGSEDFAAVSAAFKRMKNILSQAKEKGIASGSSVNAALLTEPTEKALAERSAELAGRVASLRG
jgi:glycyl-tRNA synthetase beta chain